MTETDVIVVGAGAAGIGASLALSRDGIPHIVLEAKDRVGGRAFSESHSLGHLWDHGCHWFHSADINVLRHIAERLDHPYQHRPSEGAAHRFTAGAWRVSMEETDYIWNILHDMTGGGHGAGNDDDAPASTLLDEHHALHAIARNWMKLMYSAEPERISLADAATYNDTAINLAVKGGYGALIERIASGLPIRLGVAVQRLSVGRDTVQVETSGGKLTARSVILAVPARMLETDRLVVFPKLPETLQQAFADVPMGWYEKIALAFDRDVFSGHGMSSADIEVPGLPVMSFELHPFGRPIAIAHVAGDIARDMEAQGEPAMRDLAVESLSKAFGSAIRARIVHGTATHWSSDPFIHGAYACALPGRAASRRYFREPLHERIFLAGEHTHPSFNATAHGAYESGQTAALRAAALLGHKVGEPDPLWLPDRNHGH